MRLQVHLIYILRTKRLFWFFFFLFSPIARDISHVPTYAWKQSPHWGWGRQILQGDLLEAAVCHAFPSSQHRSLVCANLAATWPPEPSASGWLHSVLTRSLAGALPADLGLKGGEKTELCAGVQDTTSAARWGGTASAVGVSVTTHFRLHHLQMLPNSGAPLWVLGKQELEESPCSLIPCIWSSEASWRNTAVGRVGNRGALETQILAASPWHAFQEQLFEACCAWLGSTQSVASSPGALDYQNDSQKDGQPKRPRGAWRGLISACWDEDWNWAITHWQMKPSEGATCSCPPQSLNSPADTKSCVPAEVWRGLRQRVPGYQTWFCKQAQGKWRAANMYMRQVPDS